MFYALNMYKKADRTCRQYMIMHCMDQHAVKCTEIEDTAQCDNYNPNSLWAKLGHAAVFGDTLLTSKAPEHASAATKKGKAMELGPFSDFTPASKHFKHLKLASMMCVPISGSEDEFSQLTCSFDLDAIMEIEQKALREQDAKVTANGQIDGISGILSISNNSPQCSFLQLVLLKCQISNGESNHYRGHSQRFSHLCPQHKCRSNGSLSLIGPFTCEFTRVLSHVLHCQESNSTL